jgi:hypothetical protein
MLSTRIWVDGEMAQFETRSQRGDSLVERGTFTFTKAQV